MKYYLHKYSYTTPEKLTKTTENLGLCGQILCRDLKLDLLNTEKENKLLCLQFCVIYTDFDDTAIDSRILLERVRFRNLQLKETLGLYSFYDQAFLLNLVKVRFGCQCNVKLTGYQNVTDISYRLTV